jgi:hypothetical protein
VAPDAPVGLPGRPVGAAAPVVDRNGLHRFARGDRVLVDAVRGVCRRVSLELFAVGNVMVSTVVKPRSPTCIALLVTHGFSQTLAKRRPPGERQARPGRATDVCRPCWVDAG